MSVLVTPARVQREVLASLDSILTGGASLSPPGLLRGDDPIAAPLDDVRAAIGSLRRSGLIEDARWNETEREHEYRITPAGRSHLRELEAS